MRLLDFHHDIKSTLALYGIEPEIERTGGGHIRFRWIAGAKQQSLVTGSTPSDWRAIRNEIAKVRRKLKDAGVKKIIRCEQTTMKQPTEPSEVAALKARIERLERDVELLLDRLTNPNPQPVPQPPEPALAPEPAPAPKVDRRKGHRANYDWLWRVMRYDEYLPVATIAEDTGRSNGAMSVLLCNLKKRKLVEHRPRIGWRKYINVELLASEPRKQEGPNESNRSSRLSDRGSRSHVSPHARTVPNGACRQAGRHLPAGPEIREGRQSNQRKPVDEGGPSTRGRARNLVERRAGARQ
jgi:hypothetical protein